MYARGVNSTALVFLILAIALAVFGAVFAYLGMSSERAYWMQRDPSGDPTRESTPFSRVARGAFRIAAAETRAPLRIAAIGVIMWWLALAALLLALILSLTS